MKIREIFESVQAGTTVYHGTAAKNAVIIKQLNKLAKPYGWICRSGSKTTPRILTYKAGGQYVEDSILLKDYPLTLANCGVDPEVVQKVQAIISA